MATGCAVRQNSFLVSLRVLGRQLVLLEAVAYHGK